jgi:arylsulfatase
MVNHGIAAERPNIVIIMADDMGFSDLGCYGSEINTPNIDRLAERGLRFTQFYNAGRCCPTRASLLTGLASHAAGVGHMVQPRPLPGYLGHLNDRCVTIGEVLGAAGYQTYLSGKWHVGEERPHWPFDRGFRRSYALVSGGTNYFRLDPERILARDDKRIEPDQPWYVTDAITDNAVTFLKEHKASDPFFMYVAYTAPHWPLHAHDADIDKYRGKYKIGWDELRKRRHARQIVLGIVDKAWPLTPRDKKVPAWEDVKDQDDADLRMAVYAAQIDRMDQGIGKLLAQLEAMSALENTLILFLADNGGCAEIINKGKPGVPAGGADSFLSYGVGWANASNTPFRLYKHWVHEGGIATPLIAHWPAGLKQKGITHEPGHLVDLMATCVDVAGTEYPQTFKERKIAPLAGLSLKSVFDGDNRAADHAIYWEHEGNRAMRRGHWKLVARNNAPWELYDLSTDRTELNDLAREQPERVQSLASAWDTWAKQNSVLPWKEVNAKRP